MNYRGEWNVFYKLRTSFEELFPGCDRNEYTLLMENSYAPYQIDGTAIAQVKFNRVEHTQWVEVDELSDTDRGSDGGLIRE